MDDHKAYTVPCFDHGTYTGCIWVFLKLGVAQKHGFPYEEINNILDVKKPMCAWVPSIAWFEKIQDEHRIRCGDFQRFLLLLSDLLPGNPNRQQTYRSTWQPSPEALYQNLLPGRVSYPLVKCSDSENSQFSLMIYLLYHMISYDIYLYIYIYLLFVSIHIYSYLFISIHIYSYLFISIHIYSYLFISIHIYSYLFISIYIYLYLFIAIYIYLYLFISIYVYLCLLHVWMMIFQSRLLNYLKR